MVVVLSDEVKKRCVGLKRAIVRIVKMIVMIVWVLVGIIYSIESVCEGD